MWKELSVFYKLHSTPFTPFQNENYLDTAQEQSYSHGNPRLCCYYTHTYSSECPSRGQVLTNISPLNQPSKHQQLSLRINQNISTKPCTIFPTNRINYISLDPFTHNHLLCRYERLNNMHQRNQISAKTLPTPSPTNFNAARLYLTLLC